MAKKPVFQNHHVVYPSEKNREVTRRIRKGVHQALTLLCRHKYLTDQEISAVQLECELRRKFDEGNV